MFYLQRWAVESRAVHSRCVRCVAEVAGVTFSDSDSAPVPKFFNPNPGPEIFQMWESDSCSGSCYNHRSNRNLPRFLLKKWLHTLLPLPKLKSDSDPGPPFHKFLTPGPCPKEKRRILSESHPVLRIRCHFWCAAHSHKPEPDVKLNMTWHFPDRAIKGKSQKS